jgi:transcriptional regulator with PAS, ATPase and Fis domain
MTRHPRPTTAPLGTTALGLAGAALGELGGTALLLDTDLRIVFATPDVAAVLGGPVPLGDRAPDIICGQEDKRPIAEALTRGQAATSRILRTTADGNATWEVRTRPLWDGPTLLGHHVQFRRGDLGGSPAAVHGILTQSDTMQRLLAQVARVARSSSAVLVRGETGTGKELVARAVHNESPRQNGPFLAINCAALPPELLESELFGHVRGAFTGAIRDTLGYFRRAHGGTLFLDEVAEMPLALQAKLLRVTQERVVVPVGGTEPVPIDVRLVSATHRSLREDVQSGRFRADLMYRLRILPLFLPPLRARQEDVELLSYHFLKRLNAQSSLRTVERISPGALRAMTHYPWPGNVRELENVIEYAFMLGDGPTLTEDELPDEVRGIAPEPTATQANPKLDPTLPAEARRLLTAVARANGNRERAAHSLGLSRTTLWRKLRAYGLEPGETQGS